MSDSTKESSSGTPPPNLMKHKKYRIQLNIKIKTKLAVIKSHMVPSLQFSNIKWKELYMSTFTAGKERERWDYALRHASFGAFSNTHEKNKTTRRKKRRGLFFSINNSFRHIGERVKLDISGENGVQRRVTRNNEEILPRTPSLADWFQESTHAHTKN